MRRFCAVIVIVGLVSGCAADDAEVGAAARGQLRSSTVDASPAQVDSPVEIVDDEPREWYEQPLLGCVEKPRDPLSLAAIFESTTISVWAEVSPDDLISWLGDPSIASSTLNVFEGDLEPLSAVESTPFAPEAFTVLEFKTYILGISPEAGRAGLYIGVAEDGSLAVLGNCQNQVGDQFRMWQQETAIVRNMIEVDALRVLVASPELQQDVIEYWYSPTPQDPLESWLALEPEARAILPTEVPATVSGLYPAVIEIEFPKWWVTSGATLCAFIPEVGWNWSCISHTVTDSRLVWQAFVADAGELEIHLTASDGRTSIHDLGTIDGLNGIGSSVLLTFDPEADSMDELVQSTVPFTTQRGEIVVETTKALKAPAEYVDNPRPAETGTGK